MKIIHDIRHGIALIGMGVGLFFWVAATTFPSSNPEIVSTTKAIGSTLFGWCLGALIGMAFVGTGTKLRARMHLDEYCTHCGKQFIQWEEQNGFDHITGKPKMDKTWRCPDWNASTYSMMGHVSVCSTPRMTTAPQPAFRLVKNAQPHHNPVDLSCQGCLDYLVSTKVFTLEEAKKFQPR